MKDFLPFYLSKDLAAKLHGLEKRLLHFPFCIVTYLISSEARRYFTERLSAGNR
jgi:hypothetical protein